MPFLYSVGVCCLISNFFGTEDSLSLRDGIWSLAGIVCRYGQLGAQCEAKEPAPSRTGSSRVYLGLVKLNQEVTRCMLTLIRFLAVFDSKEAK